MGLRPEDNVWFMSSMQNTHLDFPDGLVKNVVGLKMPFVLAISTSWLGTLC